MPSTPKIDMSKWGDRLAADLPDTTPLRPVEATTHKPVAVAISAQEVGRLYAAQNGDCDPRVFMQLVLERLKAAGAPVEGTLHLRLAHGAVARVKPDTKAPQMEFKYVWLPPEHAAALVEYALHGGMA